MGVSKKSAQWGEEGGNARLRRLKVYILLLVLFLRLFATKKRCALAQTGLIFD